MAHENQELKLISVKPSVKLSDDHICMEWFKFNSVIMNFRSLLMDIIGLLGKHRFSLNTEGEIIIDKLDSYLNEYQIPQLTFEVEEAQKNFEKESNPNEELIRRTMLNFANKDAIAEYLIAEEKSKDVDFNKTLIISFLDEYNEVIKKAANSFYTTILDNINYYQTEFNRPLNELEKSRLQELISFQEWFLKEDSPFHKFLSL